MAVLATCAFLSYRLVEEERAGRNAQASIAESSAPVEPRDISSREADPEPLTVDEVFPQDEIVINPAEPPYVVLGTDTSNDCGTAAVDELAVLLDELGCSQVVRATLHSPNEDYLVSGGIFNLKTEEGAERAYEDITPLIQDGTGRFQGLLAGTGTEPIVTSETVLFWDFRGHYLLYTVIARSDGEAFSSAANRHADVISWDLIEMHLRSDVLEQRTTAPAADEEPPAEVGEESDAAG